MHSKGRGVTFPIHCDTEGASGYDVQKGHTASTSSSGCFLLLPLPRALKASTLLGMVRRSADTSCSSREKTMNIRTCGCRRRRSSLNQI